MLYQAELHPETTSLYFVPVTRHEWKMINRRMERAVFSSNMIVSYPHMWECMLCGRKTTIFQEASAGRPFTPAERILGSIPSDVEVFCESALLSQVHES